MRLLLSNGDLIECLAVAEIKMDGLAYKVATER